MSLKGTKTEENLKAAFAGESRLTAGIFISRKRPTSKATTMSRQYSGPPQRARLVTRMGISSSSRRPVIRRRVSRSAARRII